MDIIKKVKELNFPLGEYVIIGGGILEAFGIRNTNDIDVVVTPNLLEKLRISGKYKEETRWGKLFLIGDKIEIGAKLNWDNYSTKIEEAIKTATIISGVPFLNIEEIIKFKTALGREKDFKDIKLIENYLKTKKQKISKAEAVKIADDFLETDLEKESWFIKVKPSVKAFILYGSMAKVMNKPASDIDIMIILPLEQEEKHTKGEYFYDYKEFKINIVLRSIEKLRKIVLEKKDLFQKEIFRKAEILMDTDGEVANLLKEIGKISNYATEFLGKNVTIKIDRPLNSKHPKHGFIYEVNYGFVPDTKAPDGEEIDAYLLGVDKPLDEFTGKCIAIIHRKDDDDDKLVIVPENAKKISSEKILKAVNFQEKWFDSVVIR